MRHSCTITQVGEGAVQATCSCGWRSRVFGREKRLGAMDPLQQANDAADFHEWDSDLPDADG